MLKIRGNDGHGLGSGTFGASRDGGARRHSGIDIVCKPGEPVRALNDGKYMYPHAPYINDPSYTGLSVKDFNGNTNLYFYVKPAINPGDIVKKGQIIGCAQDIAKKYSPKMTPHYHFEVRDKTWTRTNPAVKDPTKYLEGFSFHK